MKISILYKGMWAPHPQKTTKPLKTEGQGYHESRMRLYEEHTVISWDVFSGDQNLNTAGKRSQYMQINASTPFPMHSPIRCLTDVSFSSIGLIAFSVLPHLAQKVKLFMGLAPGYTLEGLQGPLKILVSLPDLMLQVSIFLCQCLIPLSFFLTLAVAKCPEFHLNTSGEKCRMKMSFRIG